MPARKKDAGAVGAALLKRQQKRTDAHKQAVAGPPALESSVERSDLDELLSTALLADRDFAAERGAPQVVLNNEVQGVFSGLGPRERRELQLAEESLHLEHLTIPRRPPWHSHMSAEEVDAQERKAFLEWRRGLARLEENEKLILTPFEKNLDIWRQLWRVLERSDVVVAVVDARNPLFYRCPDLEASVRDLDPCKRFTLLLNKADLLPLPARRQWAAYFKKSGIGCFFWSAKQATAILEGKASLQVPESGAAHSDEEETDDTRVLGRDELLERLEAEAMAVLAERNSLADEGGMDAMTPDAERTSANVRGKRMAVVGFVGYPNVGKSSTVNALVGQKRTGVTSTPGKTKHFQTLHISESLMLCDCPGLVFPSFTTSRSEMVAAGVLPIDRITDHRGPVEVVAERVPRHVLETTYGIVLPKPAPHEPPGRLPTAAELLRAYARSRGYVVASGLPDETRASRLILKDYLNGHLLDYRLPPSEEGTTLKSTGREGGMEGDDGGSGGNEEEGSEWETDEEGDSAEEAECNPRKDELNGGSERGIGREVESGEAATHGQDERFRKDTMAVLDDFDSFSLTGGNPRRQKQPVRAAHKLHMKGPRRKDRTWRVGHGGNDDSDGMPLVRGVLKPLSYGAASFATVLPKDRHLVGK